jgi:hypothetical protein
VACWACPRMSVNMPLLLRTVPSRLVVVKLTKWSAR